MDDTKRMKLQSVLDQMKRLTSFLTNYLPLANAHNSDFIVCQHWRQMLPENIAVELLTLSDDDLTSLPLLTSRPYFTSTRQSDRFEAENVFKFEKSSHSPNWVHNSLADFVASASSNTIEKLGVLTSLEDLVTSLSNARVGISASEKVVIGNFMSVKKSYEVDIMVDVCSKLASCFSITEVII